MEKRLAILAFLLAVKFAFLVPHSLEWKVNNRTIIADLY